MLVSSKLLTRISLPQSIILARTFASRSASGNNRGNYGRKFSTPEFRSGVSLRNQNAAKIQQSKLNQQPKGKSDNPFDHLEPKKIQEGEFGGIGEEISGKKLDKQMMIVKLNDFYQQQPVRELAKTHYMNEKLFGKAFISFRRYCYKSSSLPPELHVTFCDIIDGHGHVSDLFPFFLAHAREAFPHLECHEELRKISNLAQPHNWYPEARAKHRKIIFHSGPTNSGKTYHAMNRFLTSKSGLYCGPLKLLANEIFHKANENNTPCDLVTGEERRLANPDGYTPAPHASCTIEMAQVSVPVEVAIIDEIQMIRDPQRGWAWTRALLGVPADEVHLCGEEAAIDLVRRLIEPTGDILEVVKYKRLTPLVIEEKSLNDLKEVRSGDCIVCFNKDTLFRVGMELEQLGHKVAIVYGTLSPGAKLAQCKKFNELDEVKVMVATDAIGMGLNLSIGRVIFSSLMKITSDEKGNTRQEYLSTSQCLQIAGRAGRYKTAHETGYVTTYRPEDLRQLREIMSRGVPPIDQAGLHPSIDDIETFAYHLPHLDFCDLIELFIDLCEFDSDTFFMCDLETFKALANTIRHIDVALRARYLFCCAPINIKIPYIVAMFTTYVRQFSQGQPVTADSVKRQIGWPCPTPKKKDDLQHLEQVYDVLELYLWLSYRFPDMFPQPDEVRHMQKELDEVIFDGVTRVMNLLQQSPAVQSRQQ